MADKDKKVEEDQAKKIRMTLTSRNVESLERTTSELLQKAREQATVQFKGPVRLPTKHLRMTIRKSPCGEGSKTWDRFEMRIHKRVIDFACSLQQLKDITSIQISQGVEVELNLDQE